ncbi:hypothetical protein Celaphus_00004192 [Cervus elaphus hippelaphus]|uniref:Uncharacterized protein n=1 Tax=Cervus elaphus hippelaphus TaxID=46360 RepID=A0A212DCC8_CEREH|nr:hypothetical protein Celaphus_00004192 [Cervus elaphus hippelaphus]
MTWCSCDKLMITESVAIMKKLLQMHPAQYLIIKHLAKLTENIQIVKLFKLQVIINLVAKLYLTSSKQITTADPICTESDKCNKNCDIRDQVHFTQQFMAPLEYHHAKVLFLAPKPAPVLESSFKDQDHFLMDLLSHLLHAMVTGYQELPDCPEEL